MQPSECLRKLQLKNSEQLELGERYAYRTSLWTSHLWNSKIH